MKKWVWLAVLTVVCVGTVGYVRMRSHSQAIALKTTVLSATPSAQTISCNGRVETASETVVQTPTDCVVKQVMVQEGAQVKKGDVLFSVDKTATLTAMAGTDGAAAVHAALQDAVLTEVTAPSDGILRDFTAQEGAVLSGAKACGVITAEEPVQIRLSVSERHISRVQVGQKVKVSGAGFSKAAYEGYIREIASVAKQETRGTSSQTVVEAVVGMNAGETDESLRVGLTAKGAIVVSTVDAGFVLPYDAVLADEENREYVYVLEENTAVKRIITPIAELGSGYLVIDGFKNGDRLILEPNKVSKDGVYTAKEAADA